MVEGINQIDLTVEQPDWLRLTGCLVGTDPCGDGDGLFLYPGGGTPDKETLEKVGHQTRDTDSLAKPSQ